MSTPSPENPFEVSRAGLGTRAIQGVLTSGMGTVSRFAIGLVGTALLARLLTPEDYGTYEVVGAVAGIFVGVSSLGLAEATIQREQINQSQVSGLFWLNVLFGAVLFLAMVLIAPLLVWVYGDQQLGWLNVFLGITFLLSGLRVQQIALLARQHQFAKLVVVDIVGLLGGLVAAVWCALQGWGAWALAIQAVLAAASAVILLWVMSPWRPSLRLPRGMGLRSLVAFGGYVTLARLMSVLLQRVDKLLLGLFVLAATLGQYGRATYLAALFQLFIVGPIEMPARSYLSRIWADDIEKAKQQYFRYFRLMLAFPFLWAISVSIVAPELVQVLFGPQWTQAGQLFVILALGGAFRIFYSTLFTAFIGFGEGRELLKWSSLVFAMSLILYVLAAPLGPVTMSVAFTVSSLLAVAYGLLRVERVFDARSELANRENFRVSLAIVLAYGFALLVNWLVQPWTASMSYGPFLQVMITLLVAAVAGLLLVGLIARATLTDAWHIGQIWLNSVQSLRRSRRMSV